VELLEHLQPPSVRAGLAGAERLQPPGTAVQEAMGVNMAQPAAAGVLLA